jgi:hypothetical protein
MAMQLRYAGEFYSVNGTVWRCEILQEAVSAFASVGELVPSTLIIEWPEHELEEPVCGSTATLVISSEGDRTYEDLYTVLPGQIRLDVYREGVLYWSGTLDPETYEEPYESGCNYDVTLTFADFGVLDRTPYGLNGRKTLLELVTAALGLSGINYVSIDQTLISTSFPDGSALTLGSLSLPSENFFDEDGVASTWREVLDGILQPLGLRMVQRAGKIWVYDLNGLYTIPAAVRALEWDGNSSTYGTPPVYNNIKVTFSPYSKGKLTPEFEYGDVADPGITNIGTTAGVTNKTPNGNGPVCYSFYADYDPAHRQGYSWDYDNIGFTIFLSNDPTKCTGLASKGASNRFFKIVPLLGGSEAEGVAVGFRKNQHSDMTSQTPIAGITPGSHPESVAMTTKRMYLPELDSDGQEQNYIRIVMEMLADPRYNPFEDAPKDGDGNENANYKEYLSWAQQAFIPVAIVLYDAAGNALYHYTNNSITSHGSPANTVAGCARRKSGNTTIDGWVSGEASFGDAWLAYYDTDLDIVEGQGCLGFKANRQSFGKPWAEGKTASKRQKYYKDLTNAKRDWWFFESFKKSPNGQYIPYPPAGGYLEIRVYNGVYLFDDTDTFNATASESGFARQGLYEKLRWLLYKVPEVSIVKRNLTFDEAKIDDVEYSGVANADAKEDLEIETICGTVPGLCANARGIYLNTATGQQVQLLARGSRTDHPEQLLIGTLYSQYARRKVSLSGEVRMDPAGLSLYSDANQPASRKFIFKSERQDIRMDCAEIMAVEIRPDEYTGVES